MHIGIFIIATDYSITMDELGPALEQRGFESLFLPEHTHIPTSRLTPWPGGSELPRDYSHMHDPFVALAFAAAHTKSLKLGTSICLLPQRDPIVTAKTVASLDTMSGGRFVLGLGGGWNREEMAQHGTRYEDRFKILRERVLAMKALWTEEEAVFNGDFVKLEKSWAYPKPVQRPHPPILLGGESVYTLRRVVEFCDGWFPRGRFDYDVANGIAQLKDVADAAGRDMASLQVSVFGAPPDPTILETYRAAGVNRALLALPSTDRDSALRQLDEYTPLLD